MDATKIPISYDGHRHPLFLVENGEGAMCWLCTKACEPPFFQCLKCDFNLHLLCGPLPCTILHRYGFTMNLVDSLVGGNPEECCCDECEMERDPKECVYSMPEYAYVSEVKCVMTEILHAFRGVPEYVELRSVGRRIAGKVIAGGLVETEEFQKCEKDIPDDVDSPTVEAQIAAPLTEEELKQYAELCSKLRDPTLVYRRSEVSFEKFVDKLELGPKVTRSLAKDAGADYLKFVEVGDHKIAEIFVPLYQELLDKYGDISADCKFSPSMKSVLFLRLFSAINGMRGTLVLNISEQDIRFWWDSLRVVHEAGFKIQFLIDNLERLARAFFGVQVLDSEKRTLEDLDQQIEKLSEKIREMEAYVEKSEAEHEQHLHYMEAEKPSFKKFFAEAKTLKWRTLGDFLLE